MIAYSRVLPEVSPRVFLYAKNDYSARSHPSVIFFTSADSDDLCAEYIN